MAIHEVHTCLKGFIKLESFGYNLKGFFNFGDRELTDSDQSRGHYCCPNITV